MNPDGGPSLRNYTVSQTDHATPEQDEEIESPMGTCPCGTVAIADSLTPCATCEWQYQEGGVPRGGPERHCSACVSECQTCKRMHCESHMSGRECIGCAGPAE